MKITALLVGSVTSLDDVSSSVGQTEKNPGSRMSLNTSVTSAPDISTLSNATLARRYIDDQASIVSGDVLDFVDDNVGGNEYKDYTVSVDRQGKLPSDYKDYTLSVDRQGKLSPMLSNMRQGGSPKRVSSGDNKMSVSVSEMVTFNNQPENGMNRRSVISDHGVYDTLADLNGVDRSITISPQPSTLQEVGETTPLSRPSRLSASQTTLIREPYGVNSEIPTPRSLDTPDTVRLYVSYVSTQGTQDLQSVPDNAVNVANSVDNYEPSSYAYASNQGQQDRSSVPAQSVNVAHSVDNYQPLSTGNSQVKIDESPSYNYQSSNNSCFSTEGHNINASSNGHNNHSDLEISKNRNIISVKELEKDSSAIKTANADPKSIHSSDHNFRQDNSQAVEKKRTSSNEASHKIKIKVDADESLSPHSTPRKSESDCSSPKFFKNDEVFKYENTNIVVNRLHDASYEEPSLYVAPVEKVNIHSYEEPLMYAPVEKVNIHSYRSVSAQADRRDIVEDSLSRTSNRRKSSYENVSRKSSETFSNRATTPDSSIKLTHIDYDEPVKVQTFENKLFSRSEVNEQVGNGFPLPKAPKILVPVMPYQNKHRTNIYDKNTSRQSKSVVTKYRESVSPPELRSYKSHAQNEHQDSLKSSRFLINSNKITNFPKTHRRNLSEHSNSSGKSESEFESTISNSKSYNMSSSTSSLVRNLDRGDDFVRNSGDDFVPNPDRGTDFVRNPDTGDDFVRNSHIREHFLRNPDGGEDFVRPFRSKIVDNANRKFTVQKALQLQGSSNDEAQAFYQPIPQDEPEPSGGNNTSFNVMHNSKFNVGGSRQNHNYSSSDIQYNQTTQNVKL